MQKSEETQFFWLQPADGPWKWWAATLGFFIESVLACEVSVVFFNTILMEEMAFKSGRGWRHCCHRCVFEGVSPFFHPQNVELPDVFSPELKSLLEGLLQRDVSNRLGCHGGRLGEASAFQHLPPESSTVPFSVSRICHSSLGWVGEHQ